jgi:hypothetical protein
MQSPSSSTTITTTTATSSTSCAGERKEIIIMRDKDEKGRQSNSQMSVLKILLLLCEISKLRLGQHATKTASK